MYINRANPVFVMSNIIDVFCRYVYVFGIRFMAILKSLNAILLQYIRDFYAEFHHLLRSFEVQQFFVYWRRKFCYK